LLKTLARVSRDSHHGRMMIMVPATTPHVNHRATQP
jgi:hypothetical protein